MTSGSSYSVQMGPCLIQDICLDAVDLPTPESFEAPIHFDFEPVEQTPYPQISSVSIAHSPESGLDSFGISQDCAVTDSSYEELEKLFEAPLPIDNHAVQPAAVLPYMGATDVLPQVYLTDVIRADLDQLYFERVHTTIPLMNQSRYLARANLGFTNTGPFSYLQHAMWALAASMSSQLQHIKTALYKHAYARASLDMLDLDLSNDSIPIEQVQTWILLTVFEISQINCQRGRVSAGHCFRLVHLMRLHELDNHDAPFVQVPGYDVEEHRRAFWNAYCLGQYGNLVDLLPLVVPDGKIMTRLPANEDDFQADRPATSPYLQQALLPDYAQQKPLSPFAQCIVALTLAGRCLAHRRLCQAQDQSYADFIARHRSLDSVLSHRAQNTPVLCSSTDALTATADIASHLSVILLSWTLEGARGSQGDHTGVVLDYRERAALSARRLTQIVRRSFQTGFFKMHPLISIVLYTGAVACKAHQHVDPRFKEPCDTLLDQLTKQASVNNLAVTCRWKLQEASIMMDSSNLALSSFNDSYRPD